MNYFNLGNDNNSTITSVILADLHNSVNSTMDDMEQETHDNQTPMNNSVNNNNMDKEKEIVEKPGGYV